MADLFVVTNWDENFENNRTRGLKEMAWVPIPNKMDGDGYTELLEHSNGASHYAAWMAMVLVASRCRQTAGGCGEPGALLRSTAEPHDSASLARISRIPSKVFEEAIPRLLRMGWLAKKDYIRRGPHESAAFTQESAVETHPTDYGTERNGTERNGSNTPLPPVDDSSEIVDDFEAQRDRFTECWNNAQGVRTISSLSSVREGQLRKRLAETVRIAAVAWTWLDALEEMVRTKFPLKLTRGDPSGWKPDVDWILKPDSLPAIVEGKYDWEKKSGRRNDFGPGQLFDSSTAGLPTGFE